MAHQSARVARPAATGGASDAIPQPRPQTGAFFNKGPMLSGPNPLFAQSAVGGNKTTAPSSARISPNAEATSSSTITEEENEEEHQEEDHQEEEQEEQEEQQEEEGATTQAVYDPRAPRASSAGFEDMYASHDDF